MAPHSSTLAWKIPWMEELGRLQSMLRVDTTERLPFHFSLLCTGEGNGNPLQCYCLENPRDGEPGGLPSMGSHRVGHDWSDLAAPLLPSCCGFSFALGCGVTFFGGFQHSEDEMVAWNHWFNGHEFEQTLGDREGGKPGMLQSMGSQRIGHNLVTEQQQKQSLFTPSSLSPPWEFNFHQSSKWFLRLSVPLWGFHTLPHINIPPRRCSFSFLLDGHLWVWSCKRSSECVWILCSGKKKLVGKMLVTYYHVLKLLWF